VAGSRRRAGAKCRIPKRNPLNGADTHRRVAAARPGRRRAGAIPSAISIVLSGSLSGLLGFVLPPAILLLPGAVLSILFDALLLLLSAIRLLLVVRTPQCRQRLKRFRQIVDKVAGNQRNGAERFGRQIARQSMQIHPK